mgnify:FL=1
MTVKPKTHREPVLGYLEPADNERKNHYECPPMERRQSTLIWHSFYTVAYISHYNIILSILI